MHEYYIYYIVVDYSHKCMLLHKTEIHSNRELLCHVLSVLYIMSSKNEGELDGDYGDGEVRWMEPDRMEKTPMLGMKNFHERHQWWRCRPWRYSWSMLSRLKDRTSSQCCRARGKDELGTGESDAERVQYELALKRA